MMMRKRLRFECAALVERNDELGGPARGWYQIYTFPVAQEPDLEELKWCLREAEHCALVLLDIGSYRDAALDEAALANIDRILGFFRQQKKDIILRVAYDTQGSCLEQEPTLFSRVIGHIRQLGPVIGAYNKSILLFEGMLVGNWGEMHGSRFLTKKYMEQLNAALAQSLPGVPRAVRRPVQWRMLHPAQPEQGTGIGLFNDGIFGSETDLGTFAEAGCQSTTWEEAWPPERELAFEQRISALVPQCGEAVLGDTYGTYTLRSTVERLRKMGLTCLNGVYDDRILDLWRSWSWEGSDLWHGMSGYDYIGRHLGYRFCVKSAAARQERDAFRLTLTVENSGFSGFYQEAEVWLVLREEAGQERRILTGWDIREWKSGQAVSLHSPVPGEAGTLWLCARRKWDGAPIPFANASNEPGLVRIGELKKA